MAEGLLNVGSLVLGLVAWTLPVLALLWAKGKVWPVMSAVSLAACAVSLFLQMQYNSYLVDKQDWSALMDTSEATVRVAGLMLGVTLVLNAILLAVRTLKK